MPILTKAQLEALNQSSFPDNTTGAITPQILRTYNTATIDTLVDSLDTGSFATDISSLNAFTASQEGINTALNASTASQQVSINALNSFTASQLTINSGYNAFTSSTDAKFATIGSQSGSWGGGGSINTGSLATTGSNIFTGNQTITGSLFVSASAAGYEQAVVFNVPNTGGPGSRTGVHVNGRLSVNGPFEANTLDIGSIFTNNLYASTGGANAKIQVRNTLLIQENDTTTNLGVSGSVDISGSLRAALQDGYAWVGNSTGYSTQVPTASFAGAAPVGVATTGSNNFVGDQTITGSVNVSGGEHLFIRRSTTGAVQDLRLGATDNGNNFAFIVTGSDQNPGQQVWGINIGGGQWANSFDAGVVFNSYVTASNGIRIQDAGTFSAPLQQGYVWVGDSNNRTSLIPTSSFGGGGTDLTSLNAFTASILGTNAWTASIDTKFATIGTQSGSWGGGGSINTGSFATTGSNVFLGDQTYSDTAGNATTLVSTSGSLMLVAKSFTSASAHLSSSANNFVNLIFKNNSGAHDTIVTGSNNIFTNPINAATTGFKRYIGGSQNYFGLTLPQLTGSAQFSPAMSNNVISTGMLMRTPVSSSAYTIAGNVLTNYSGNGIQLGTSATNNFEKAVSGLTLTNNSINGTLTATAYKTFLSQSVSIGQNNIGGTLALNMDSSSISIANSLVQGSTTVNNSYFPSTYNSTTAGISIGSYVGIGQGHILYASGSNTSTSSPARTFNNVGIIGQSNTISASLNGDNAQVHSTTLLGQSLNVIGTNTRAAGVTAADWGSAFVGRWNDFSGTKGQTAETVFAVGTGTGTSTRKTGFLIDSGSNTFVEGSLNVSGSTSTTGSITIQSGSGDLYVHGNKQFNVGAFQSDTTQSGSANVSQSMQFETTDISNGVTMVDNSKITFANSGTYNIQFSVQVDRVSGSGTDEVYIWLKKNGTNVDKTAGAITISGGAAEAKTIAAWNYVVETTNSDYYELAWQSTDSNIQLINAGASGNIPSIPSIILTVTQVR